MVIKYIAEPSYMKTIWFKETLNGIKDKSNTLKYKIKEITKISEDIDVLMVIGTSPSWVSKILDMCKAHNIFPLVVSCHPISQSTNTSYILINHDDATKECIDYLKQCEKNNIALYGVNINSYADMIKKKYFDDKDVYYISDTNKLQHCFKEFKKNCGKYNAVICTNYICAVWLITELKKIGIRIPEDMYIICYGDSVLGRRISPSITNITLDHMLLGMQAVQLYRYIYKNRENVAVTVSVPCRIIPAETTEYKFYNKKIASNIYEETDDFMSDDDIVIIQNLERLLRETDDIDIAIIDAILYKRQLTKMADELYISESSIKYRIKRMLQISNFENFAKLCDIYKRYVKNQDI